MTPPARSELFRALGTLCERPEPAHAALGAALGLPGAASAADHTDLFVLQLVPYASVYTGADGMLGGEAADRVAGFWRALHLTPPAEPDHLAALLGLYAELIDREAGEPEPARAVLWRHARGVLLWEHLLAWVPAYLSAAASVARANGAPFYRAWADLLAEALLDEAHRLPAPPEPAAGPGTPPATPETPRATPETPRATPEAPPVDDIVATVLVPARGGMIITRVDLATLARHTGVGLRIGERAFALRAMLDQDTDATLAWLSDAAQRWRAWHEAAEPVLGGIARDWRGRTETATRVLDQARRAVPAAG